jgi:hypothetical protein
MSFGVSARRDQHLRAISDEPQVDGGPHFISRHGGTDNKAIQAVVGRDLLGNRTQ